MPTRNPMYHARSRRNGFPIQTAAIELGICMATYVAFWVILRALASPDAAAAIAPASPTEQSAAPAVQITPAEVSESLPSDPFRRMLNRPDNARECTPEVARESKCVVN